MVLARNVTTAHRAVYTLRIVTCVWTVTVQPAVIMRTVRHVLSTRSSILRQASANAMHPIAHQMTSSASIAIQHVHYARMKPTQPAMNVMKDSLSNLTHVNAKSTALLYWTS